MFLFIIWISRKLFTFCLNLQHPQPSHGLQCCQNSLERTKSVFLSNSPFGIFSARFIKRISKTPFFLRISKNNPNITYFCSKNRHLCQKIHNFLNSKSQDQNIFKKYTSCWMRKSFFQNFLKKMTNFWILENINA